MKSGVEEKEMRRRGLNWLKSVYIALVVLYSYRNDEMLI